MLSAEAVIVIVGWLVSLGVALFVVPVLAARRTMQKFGLVEVEQDGRKLYAVEGPDGEPIRVPVQYQTKDGKVEVRDQFVPLAYALPTIAAVQTKAFLTSTIQGKAGKYKQMADRAAMADMPIEQAANAMALEAFMRGQYGKAIMAYLAPRIAAGINASGNAGQEMAQGQTNKWGIKP